MRIYYINNKKYRTKSSVLDLVKNILNKYSFNETVDAEDSKVLLDLLKYHKEYEKKRGNGIDKFKVEKTPWNKKGFIIYRKNGSFTDFSYPKCINHPSLLSDIKRCCRHAIHKDILNFKNKIFDNAFTIICPITNKKITRDNCHIDHYNPTFKEIFNMWIKDKKISEEDINITEDNNFETYFVNSSLRASFRNFHNKIANLRAVSIKANLSIIRREKKDGE